jgi:hypothetical protein
VAAQLVASQEGLSSMGIVSLFKLALLRGLCYIAWNERMIMSYKEYESK